MFAKTFWTPYSQYKDRIGQPFEVVEEIDPSTYDRDEVGRMWKIRFNDGTVIEVYEEEVVADVIADVKARNPHIKQ